MKFTDAIILAGGFGTRMLPITDYVPKPLVKVHNKSLIRHVIDFLKINNVENIYATYGYKGDLLLNEIHGEITGFINTSKEDNAYFLFYSLIKYIDRPLIVCPCDMIVNLDLQMIEKEYENLGSPIACIVPVITNLDADAIQLEGNRVKAISREEKSKIFASGIQILNPKKINDLIFAENILLYPNFYFVWNFLISKNMLYCTTTMPTAWKIYDKLTDLS